MQLILEGWRQAMRIGLVSGGRSDLNGVRNPTVKVRTRRRTAANGPGGRRWLFSLLEPNQGRAGAPILSVERLDC